MKLDKDVFISYAHKDNRPIDQNAKGWVSEFHRLLEVLLENAIGEEVNVWRDERLTGNEVFSPEIEAQLPHLKAMVSIITPRYLVSDWCKREMDCFYKAADENGGLAIGNKSRIFKIVKTPVDPEAVDQLPENLHRVFDEVLDYRFYKNEDGSGKFRELGPYTWLDNNSRQEYMNKVGDVAQDIAELFRNLKKMESLDRGKRKVFLAETTYDLEEYRDNLARELKQAGFTVLPNKNFHFILDKFNEEVDACLDQCILSVHLVSSTNYAVQPEGSDKSIVVLQNEIAARKSASAKLQRLIWIPPATQNAIVNEKMRLQQQAFVEQLKVNPDLQRGADILDGQQLETLKQAIFDTIKRMDEEEKARHEAEEKAKREAEEKAKKISEAQLGNAGTTSTPQAAKKIYLICDQRDLENTDPLQDLIYDSGHDYMLPLFQGDQTQLRAAHENSLVACDAIIIYYGAGNKLWAESMKSDLLRLPGLGRTKPLLAQAIYLASPTDKYKERFRANDIEIINGITGFSGELFNGFIQKLK